MKKTLLFIVLICFSNKAITQCYESIHFGSSHSIGKKADGTIWGWGYAFGGTLLTSNESEPYPIQIGLENQWESVYLGVSNTFAIKVDGTLWGCGSNQQGALGINSLGDFIYSFQQITTANNWVKVAPSYFFTIALKADGTIWAWGQNDFNQTGQSPAADAQLAPMQVGTNTDWVDIDTNTNRTAFAIKADGTIWGWGSNSLTRPKISLQFLLLIL
jgi:alpha-tubulin suppressor-like RCC1 family protein